MPDILLPNKLLIPYSRPELVTRRRLIDELEQGTYRTLPLISAPAGFGKTTLAAEWIDQLRQEESRDREVRAAWLSLDESDNDFQRFLTYFLTALVQLDCIDPESERLVTEMLRSQNPPLVESIFSPLLASLSATRKKIIIVLDDYHLIEDIPIHKALNFWLERTPPQVHTVVLTREDPPFPLARMRAKNLLTELRATDLRFTASESAQFLNEVMKLGLDAPSAAALGVRTEGWIAGLQMAALSMRNRKDTASFIRNFSGTNRYILDYLLEEVLANQTPDIQKFLLQTSILKQLTGPLCDRLLGGDPVSASLLRSLDEANLFLIPLDDQRSWYRYHHLFSDLLRARLWRWHTTWCPGWKAYQAHLQESGS